MKFCTACGSPVEEEGVRFCRTCGAPLGGAEVAGGDAPGSLGSGSSEPGRTDTMYVSGSGLDSSYTAGGSVNTAPENAAPMNAAPMNAAPMNAAPMNMGGVAPQQNVVGGAVAQQRSSKAPIIVIAISAVVIIAAAAFLAYLFLFPQSKTETTYSVQFETAGGDAIATTHVDEGASVTAPASPTKEGYEFEGWYYDAEYTNEVTFPFEAGKDVVLYAKWTESKDGSSSSEGKASGGSSSASGSAASSSSSSSSASSSSSSSRSGSSSAATSSSSTVTISVVGQDGQTRTAEIHRQGSTQRVLPDSNTRRYSESEIKALSDAERCIAWNEIIAASNGYSFKNSGLRNYFEKYCDWYTPVSGASGSGNLSAAASDNIDLLKKYTDSWWLNLATY